MLMVESLSFIPDFMEVLTDSGWLELSHYNPKGSVLVLDKDFKLGYLKPKEFSNYKYKGVLIEIYTDSCLIYCKPNVSILTNEQPCKSRDIKKGNLLTRYNMWTRVESVHRGEWEGTLKSLFFGEEVYLPVRYNTDYCLLVV